ncbi:MAG: glycosyltransferase family 1 protein [Chlorobi bacterium]|nr:glycosyltransferase family 1 protein [Chlorobiota bacterium]
MTPDKIILVTTAPKGIGLAWFYYRAFKDINAAKKIEIITEDNRDYNASIIKRGIRKINYKLGRISFEKRKEIEGKLIDGKNIVMLFNNSDLLPDDIKALSDNKNVFLTNYFSDHLYALHPTSKDTAFKTIPLFDIIFTFAIDLLPVYYQHGAKLVKRIPFAYCKYTHLNPTKNIQPEFLDTLFYFGTHTPMIENWLKNIDNSIKLQIEGSSWLNANDARLKKIGTKQKPKSGEAMTVYARKAGAVINFTRANHGCFHTMKTFELAIAKTANITNFSREQQEFFKDGSFLYFNTFAEMNYQIEKALKNKNLNLELREIAYEQALPHTYKNRAEMLMSYVKNIL